MWKPLDDEFEFTLDVAASKENTKCTNYISEEQDAMRVSWSGACWLNPPYGRGYSLSAWVRRANEQAKNGCIVVMLIPARTNTEWWHTYCQPAEVRFVRGRPKFGGAKYGLPWPLAIVIMKPDKKRNPDD